MSAITPDLISMFQAAGWYSGRRVEVDPAVPSDHPAHQVLGELGGLQLPKLYGDYEVCEIDFQYVPLKEERIRLWEEALGVQLIGIAELHNAHGEMLLSDSGHVFGNSYIHPAFWYDGRTLGEAIRNIWIGEQSRPMLLDHEASVMLYGRTYTRDDPAVLGPNSPELKR